MNEEYDEYKEKLKVVARAFYEDGAYESYDEAYDKMLADYLSDALPKSFIDICYKLSVQ